MTLRRLITITEIDAEATECGHCQHRAQTSREADFCHQFFAWVEDAKRLPECLAAEAGTYQPTAPTRDQ